MRARFDEMAGSLIEAVTVGASLPEACDRAGVKIATARGWLRKGRRGAARYMAFAEAVDAARDAQRMPERSSSGALTRDELELLVAEKARAGSIAAMRLWVDLHRSDDSQPQRNDPFARFDELATRRQRHVA